MLVVIGAIVLWPGGDSGGADPLLLAADPIDAHVTIVEDPPCVNVPSQQCRVVSFDSVVASGSGTGGSFETSLDSPIRVGDDIQVTAVDRSDGGTTYSFYEFQRRTPLLILIGLFAAAVIALGGGAVSALWPGW